MPTIPSQVAGAAAPILSVWANNFASNAAGATGHGSLVMFPLSPAEGVFPGLMTAKTLLVGMSASFGLFDSRAFTVTARLGLYTLANSTQLSLLNSVSSTLGTGVASSTNPGLWYGPRQLSFHSSQWSAVPALSRTHYWMGLHLMSSGYAIPGGVYGVKWFLPTFSGNVGVGNTNSSASRPFPGMGVYSSSFSTALPSSVGFSQLRQADNAAFCLPTIIINNIGA